VVAVTLLAALATGVVVYLVAGVVTGRAPTVRLARRPRPRRGESTATWLAQAGVATTPARFWGGCAGLGVATFGVLTAITSVPAVAVVPAVGAALLPRVVLARRRAQRMREVAEAWPDGLREITAAVAAGMSLSQALTRLAETGPEALRHAFGRFPVLARMVGLAPALEVIKAELADPTSDRVIEVLLLAHEQGGPVVVDILRDLAEATTEEAKTAEEIATAGLEQKLNGRAVLFLPWVVLMLLVARPGQFQDFYRTDGGLIVIVAAAALSLLGAWILGRLGRDPVEQRVLAGPGAGP
jgi:tight adherence protein B